jgi:hypothetical protein
VAFEDDVWISPNITNLLKNSRYPKNVPFAIVSYYDTGNKLTATVPSFAIVSPLNDSPEGLKSGPWTASRLTYTALTLIPPITSLLEAFLHVVHNHNSVFLLMYGGYSCKVFFICVKRPFFLNLDTLRLGTFDVIGDMATLDNLSTRNFYGNYTFNCREGNIYL